MPTNADLSPYLPKKQAGMGAGSKTSHPRMISDYEQHKRGIEQAKTTIDNSPPRSHPHHTNNLNRMRMEEERMAEIDRENMLLLEKIAKVMRDGGDTRSMYKNSPIKSMNNEKRRKELVKIMYENIGLLKRLMNKQTHYSKSEYDKNFADQQDLVAAITKYPMDKKTKKMLSDKIDAASRSVSKTSASSKQGDLSGNNSRIMKGRYGSVHTMSEYRASFTPRVET